VHNATVSRTSSRPIQPLPEMILLEFSLCGNSGI
jgi:hypothetical protein